MQYQAARALKGKELRIEDYGLDRSPAAAVPYSITDSTYDVDILLPPIEKRRPDVLKVSSKEAVTPT